jgi:protein-S-isoprenylcysteine O-methyltransferase Ste14
MSRIAIFAYGILCYLVFFAVFLYGIGFIGGFLTPTSLDGVPTSSLGHALTVDLALLAAFAVQHSGMARPAFKTWWKRFVPEAAERSTYVLLSSLALVALYIFWEPIGGVIWSAAVRRGAQQHHRTVPFRMAAASVHDLPHRPLRSVWSEAGMAAASRQNLPRSGISHP